MIYPSLKHFLATLKQNCLLLARHGETDWNALGLIQGQQDRPLSPKGFKQRKDLFFQLQPVPLANIYSSTLQRAIHTVQPLCEEKKISLITVPELNEAKLGIFEGEHKVNFSENHSRLMYEAFLQDEINVILPGGGENLKAIHARIQKPLQEILDSVSRHGHVLVVAHRNINKMLVQSFLDLDFDAGYRVEHCNNWLYIFAPKSHSIYLMKIESSVGEVKITQGYEEID